MAQDTAQDTAQLNKPVSIRKTQVGWSSTAPAIFGGFLTSSAVLSLKDSRLLFELRVLGSFLKEMIAHPMSTSRVSVDSQRRTITVDRR